MVIVTFLVNVAVFFLIRVPQHLVFSFDFSKEIYYTFLQEGDDAKRTLASIITPLFLKGLGKVDFFIQSHTKREYEKNNLSSNNGSNGFRTLLCTNAGKQFWD